MARFERKYRRLCKVEDKRSLAKARAKRDANETNYDTDDTNDGED